MRYAGIIKNDIAAAPGVCVSFFTQGCPFHCEGCHNPETWDYDGGKEFTDDVMNELLESISANGIHRDLCIMGGEPLCSTNKSLTRLIMSKVLEVYPDIKIYIWTGHIIEDLIKLSIYDDDLSYILDNYHCIIDGKFELDKRDITLFMRGSSNQRIWYKDWRNMTNEKSRY